MLLLLIKNQTRRIKKNQYYFTRNVVTTTTNTATMKEDEAKELADNFPNTSQVNPTTAQSARDNFKGNFVTEDSVKEAEDNSKRLSTAEVWALYDRVVHDPAKPKEKKLEVEEQETQVLRNQLEELQKMKNDLQQKKNSIDTKSTSSDKASPSSTASETTRSSSTEAETTTISSTEAQTSTKPTFPTLEVPSSEIQPLVLEKKNSKEDLENIILTSNIINQNVVERTEKLNIVYTETEKATKRCEIIYKKAEELLDSFPGSRTAKYTTLAIVTGYTLWYLFKFREIPLGGFIKRSLFGGATAVSQAVKEVSSPVNNVNINVSIPAPPLPNISTPLPTAPSPINSDFFSQISPTTYLLCGIIISLLHKFRK